MIIASSNVNMASSRNYSRSVQFKTAVFQWTAGGRRMRADSYISSAVRQENSYFKGSDNYNGFARLTANPDRFASLNSSRTAHMENTSTGNAADNPQAERETLKVTILDLLDMMQNARFKKMVQGSGTYQRFTLSEMKMSDSAFQNENNILSLTSSLTPTVWNRVQTSSYFMEETESTAFCGKGMVRTADGRNLDFNVTFEMSRRFTESREYAEFSQYQQILTDPLIINLDNCPTAITDKKFFFDLDCDGKKEEISQLAAGHGYLALDKNKDGVINDGSELFGTRSGNGFKDLSVYDADGNGWIDEADPIYSQLKIWTKDENGRDVLLSLKEADVGAICLTSSQTPFALKDEAGNLNGMVRSSGIYLKENGEARTVQQVDF